MQHRIVIVGAGFAGLWSALAARRLLTLNKGKPGAADIEVVVIAPEQRLVLRPRLYEPDPASMTAPLDELFHTTGVRFIKGIVKNIRTEEQEVEIADMNGENSILSYDRLILAAGSRLVRPNVSGVHDHAFSIDQLEEATQLETHLQNLATVSASTARNTVVVCGDGFSGIELAAELPARLRLILGKDADVRVVLVGQEAEVGSSLGPGPRPNITQALADLGVDVKLGAAITAIDAGGVVTATGERIETLTAVWTAGVSATPLAAQIPGKKDSAGRLYVDRELRVPTAKGVFATGDAAYAATDDNGNYAMMSCQHAMPLGRSAGNNAAAELLNLATIPYSQPYYGTCLDLGGYGAVVTNGWDRKVFCAGAEAKKIKQYINSMLIYPPKADLAEVFAAADPTVETPVLVPV